MYFYLKYTICCIITLTISLITPSVFSQTPLDITLQKANKELEKQQYSSALLLFKKATQAAKKEKNNSYYYEAQQGSDFANAMISKPNKYLASIKKTHSKALSKKNVEEKTIAKGYYWIGILEYQKKNYREALINLFEAWQIHVIKAKKSTIVHFDLANINYAIAQTYSEINQPLLAINSYKEAIASYSKTIEKENRNMFDVYFNTANTAYQINNQSEALSFYTSALSIYKNHSLNDSTKLAELYKQKGKIFIEKGEYSFALSYLLKSINIAKKLYGNQDKYIGDLCFHIARCYQYSQSSQVAINYYQKAKEIFEKNNLKTNSEYIAIYNNLGYIYQQNQDFETSRKWLYTSNKLMIANNYSKDSIALGYQNIAHSYQIQNDYKLALENFHLALDVIQDKKNHSLILSNIYHHIGEVHNKQAQYDSTEFYYIKAYEYSKLSIKNQRIKADHFIEMANLCYKIKKYTTAISYLKKVTSLDNGYLSYNEQQRTELMLGDIYRTIGNLENSIAHHEQALNILTKKEGNNSHQLSILLNALGKDYLLLGEAPKALRYFQKSIACNTQIFTDTTISHEITNNLSLFHDHEQLLESIYQKGKAFNYLYTTKKSYNYLLLERQHYKKALELIDIIKLQKLSSEEKKVLEKNNEVIYSSLLKNYLTDLEIVPKSNVHEDIFKLIQNFNSNRLQIALNDWNTSGNTAINKDSILLMEEKRLDLSVARYYFKNREDIQIKKNLQDRISKHIKDLTQFKKETEAKYPKYFRLQFKSKFNNISETKKHLKDKEAIINYHIIDSTIYIFTLDKKDFKITTILASKSDLNKIESIAEHILYQENEKYVDAAHVAYKKLFPHHNKYKKIYILDNPWTQNIPLNALITKKTPSQEVNHFDQHPYLVQKIELVHINNFDFKTEVTIEKQQHSVLYIAPTFEQENTSNINENERKLIIHAQNQWKISSESNSIITKDNKIVPMKVANDFAKVLYKSSYKHSFKYNSLIESSATTEYFKKSIKSFSPDHLILYTHTFLNAADYPKSGLLLSRTPNKQQRALYLLSDIYNTKLPLKLLFIPATHTLCKREKSNVNTLFINAWKHAGVNNLITTLWEHDEASNGDFIAYFYANLFQSNPNNSLSYSTAYRQAILSIIKDSNYSNPYFWAHFTIHKN